MKVYVLNINNDDESNYTYVFSTLEKAIDFVMEEYRMNSIEDLFVRYNVEGELREEMYNKDGNNNYSIMCCEVM